MTMTMTTGLTVVALQSSLKREKMWKRRNLTENALNELHRHLEVFINSNTYLAIAPLSHLGTLYMGHKVLERVWSLGAENWIY